MLVQPYCKSINVFTCPDDSRPDGAAGQNSDWGVSISYAINAACNDDGFPNGLRGIAGTEYSAPASQPLARVNSPSETVMVTEKHGDDIAKGGVGFLGTNYSARWQGCMFLGNISTYYDWGTPTSIPDGSRAATAAYPYGQAGSVSTKHAGFSNFLFCDGHVKAMKPTATNPQASGDTQAVRDSKNMWDALRKS